MVSCRSKAVSDYAKLVPMNKLVFRFEPDDEWCGELFVFVAADGFAGIGSAWFDKGSLRNFAESLRAFPLPTDKPARLEGGLGGNDTTPPQTTINLSFEPHDVRGAVRVKAHLETTVWQDQEKEHPKTLSAQFQVSYGDLGSFATAIDDMIAAGITGEAVLTASAN